jgi:putative transposase
MRSFSLWSAARLASPWPSCAESSASPARPGYKIFDRYQQCGVEGLTDRSRRPYRYANQLPFQVENYILNVKREHSSCARKIRERFLRRFSGITIPAKSAIHVVLESLRPGRASRTNAAPRARYSLVPKPASQRPLVHRLQGRVLPR